MSPRLFLGLLALLLGGCAGSPSSVAPLTAADNGYLGSEREQKLHRQADQVHQQLLTRGLLVTDPALNDYLRKTGQRLLPPLPAGLDVQFFILKDASINAMALPNGHIYVNTGLIVRLQSEDQLAHVLAHEAVHVIHRHAYKGLLDRHNTHVAAHITDLMLFGTGLAYIPFSLELASFSRDQEREADLIAIDYVRAQGYDAHQGIEVFDKLVEVKHAEDTGSVWNSHPDLNQRKQYSTQKLAQLGEAVLKPADAATFETFRAELVDLNIQLRLLNGQYRLALDAIEHEIQRKGTTAHRRAQRGDALRHIGERPEQAAREHAWLYKEDFDEPLKQRFKREAPGQLDAALVEYLAALDAAPGQPEALRGIGMIKAARGETTDANRYLQDYLRARPTAADRRFIENTLTKLQHKE